MRICHVNCRLSVAASWLLASALLAPAQGIAEEGAPVAPAAEASAVEPKAEVFSGGILAGHSWTSWTGGVGSFAGSLYDSGFRLRAVACLGQYDYEMGGGAINRAYPSLVELTPGYQLRTGPLTTKLYLGLHAEKHWLQQADAGNRSSETGLGAKVLSETWLDLPFNSFVSLDLSYAGRNGAHQGMLRAGSAHYLPKLQLGGEAGVIGDETSRQYRIGGLARYTYGRSMIEASGGYALDYDAHSTPYVGLSLTHKF
jgi:hypothetical protein